MYTYDVHVHKNSNYKIGVGKSMKTSDTEMLSSPVMFQAANYLTDKVQM